MNNTLTFLSTYPTWILNHWLSFAITLAVIVVGYWIFHLTLALLNRRHLISRSTEWLELTPPASIAKTPAATEQLFSVVHGLRASRRMKERLLHRAPVMSFEIDSTKAEGIRYLIHVDTRYSQAVQKSIASYIPDSKVQTIEGPHQNLTRVIEFKQLSHYVLPLTLTGAFEEHDPLSYITGAMTKLEDGERITMQLVVMPVKLREASSLSHRILGNENILQQINSKRWGFLGFAKNVLSSTGIGMIDLMSDVSYGTLHGYSGVSNQKQSQYQQQMRTTRRDRPARTLSAFELELMESMHQKVTQPLFQVSLRVLVTSPRSKEHIAAIRSALDAYSVPPYQEIKVKIRIPVISTHRAKLADLRLPTLSKHSAMILATTEVASLYHFPSSRISKTDNLVTSLSRTLAAPVSLKSGKQLAIEIGENQHHGTSTPIGLTEAERERHLYIIGGTGNGKTTMLQYAITQDILNGNGLAVIDPHGDMAETLLKHIPESRIKDVIYMNPDDLTHPIGVNLLELPEGLEGDDLLREKDLITESTISVMRKIFSDDDSGGHRVEYILRNTIQTALTLERPTLFTIFELLNNPKFLREVKKTLTDQNLKDFWTHEIGKAGDMQKVKMSAGITAKIGRFLFSASARRVLEQEKSTINFDQILDEGKILICNFSKGYLGEDTSALFGTTILAKLQLAALHRARTAQADRKSFYLYVDEFQNFATMSFVQMLSEARKYKLFLTMAEQSTSQQDQQRLVDIILANVGTVVCFRSGSPVDERLVLPLFGPYIQQGEIANLPAYSYYVRIAAVHPQEPMSGVTILLKNEGSNEIAERVITSSREKYAIEVEPAGSISAIMPIVDQAESKPKTQPGKRSKTQTARNTRAVSTKRASIS